MLITTNVIGYFKNQRSPTKEKLYNLTCRFKTCCCVTKWYQKIREGRERIGCQDQVTPWYANHLFDRSRSASENS